MLLLSNEYWWIYLLFTNKVACYVKSGLLKCLCFRDDISTLEFSSNSLNKSMQGDFHFVFKW